MGLVILFVLIFAFYLGIIWLDLRGHKEEIK